MPTAPKSGFFQTPSNTPSGKPKAIAVDNPYLSKAEFLTTEVAAGLGISTSSAVYTSGRLDYLLLAASAEINGMCRRWFDTQTIDETKTGISVRPFNPQLVTVVLQNKPYTNINTIYLQVLKWFIQIDTEPQSGYLQDFPDYGYYRIVPLLSNAGTGAGSPMPAELVDKTPLGVVWTNYTFGYGTAYTALTLPAVSSSTTIFQAPLYFQLWAPSQTVNIYANGTIQPASAYTIDYPNGLVTFNSAPTGPITADFTSNESIPRTIKECVILMVGETLGQAQANALGATGYTMQTFSINFGKKTYLRERIERMLEPYISNMPVII